MENQDFQIKCNHCNTLNESKSKFCINCGNSLQSVQPLENKIKCPKCSTMNRPGSSFCASCGKNLSGKHISKKKKRKLVSKLYRDSKKVIKSAHSQGIRKTAKKETKHLLKSVDDLTDGKLSETLDYPGKYGYLVCSACHKYYPLKKGINPDEFKVCTCGGKLSFHKSHP